MVAGDEGQSSAQLTPAHGDPTVSSVDTATWTPYIKGLVEDQAVTVFLDTGAALSLISETLRNHIPALKHRPLLKSYQVAHTLTGQQLDILGSLPVTLRLGSHTFSLDMYVVRDSRQDVLLGWDFFKTHGALIDTVSGFFMIKNDKIPLLSSSQTLPFCCNVSLLSQVSVPPLTEIVVPASVTCATEMGSQLHGFQGILEPNVAFDKDLAVARSFSNVVNGLTVVHLLNPTHQDIDLPKEAHLGQLYSVRNMPSDLYVPVTSSVAQVTVSNPSCQLPDVHVDTEILTSDEVKVVHSLLQQNCDVFSTNPVDLGRTNLIKHNIHTSSESPLRQKAYRTSPVLREEIHKQVQKLLDADLIEPSHSPWASPVILVRKKDGSYRFCIDYRRLNSITVKDAHPLPRVDDSLDALAGATLFSTLDLSSGYWQIPMEDASMEKTAFTTGDSLYHFKVLPMGLTNAPPTFQRLMELVLRGLHWSKTLVYLDDIIVFSKSFHNHITDLTEVFSRLRQAGLKLHPQKCQLFKQSVLFLGHIVSKDGIKPDPKVTDKVLNWPRPTTPTEMRAFMGLCSYYRRFIEGFADRAAPLHALTQKHAKFIWTEG